MLLFQGIRDFGGDVLVEVSDCEEFGFDDEFVLGEGGEVVGLLKEVLDLIFALLDGMFEEVSLVVLS